MTPKRLQEIRKGAEVYSDPKLGFVGLADVIHETLDEIERLRSTCEAALAHVRELEDAWQRESAEKGALPADLVSAAERILQQEPKGGE